jgi:hypothetical protein
VGTKKEKHLIIMRIVSIEIPVKEPYCNVKIQWKRGDLKLETTSRIVINPDQPCTQVDQIFKKLSAFYRSTKSGKYQQKMAHISVKGQPNGASATAEPGSIK